MKVVGTCIDDIVVRELGHWPELAKVVVPVKERTSSFGWRAFVEWAVYVCIVLLSKIARASLNAEKFARMAAAKNIRQLDAARAGGRVRGAGGRTKGVRNDIIIRNVVSAMSKRDNEKVLDKRTGMLLSDTSILKSAAKKYGLTDSAMKARWHRSQSARQYLSERSRSAGRAD